MLATELVLWEIVELLEDVYPQFRLTISLALPCLLSMLSVRTYVRACVHACPCACDCVCGLAAPPVCIQLLLCSKVNSTSTG